MRPLDISVRLIRSEEKGRVRGIMRRAFSLPVALFFSLSDHVLVAEQERRLLGAVVLEMFPLPDGRKAGEIAWIFTDPEARGLGAGQALVEGGLDYLEATGCDEVFAVVEGNDSSSFKLFATRGFSILSPGEQFRRYSLRTFLVWVRALHFSAIGHFLWARPPEESADRPALQWWVGLLLNVLLAGLALWRRDRFPRVGPLATGSQPGGLPQLGAVTAGVLLLLDLRHGAMVGAAALKGVRVRFRAWESTFPTTLIVGLLFGVFFPAPGGLYPEGDDWRYEDLLPKLGPMGLAGSLTVLLLTWAAWTARVVGGLPPAVEGWIDAFLLVAVPLALLDTVLAFFPFTGFNGRRLWDWSRPLWALLSLTAVAVLFVR